MKDYKLLSKFQILLKQKLVITQDNTSVIKNMAKVPDTFVINYAKTTWSTTNERKSFKVFT